MFKKIGIIGLGLIGGSIALAIKKFIRSNIEVVGMGRNVNKLKIAKKIGAIDYFTDNINEGVRDCDLVLICTPVEKILPILEEIIPYISEKTLLSDVGSVKYPILSGVKKLFKKKKNFRFIGSHPIAGSEKTGIENAKADLFTNSTCVLCYEKGLSAEKDLKNLKDFWKSIGSRIEILDAKKHDKILAYTSHLMHLISFAIISKVGNNVDFKKFIGNSFRDMTRVAKSNAHLWSWICYLNRSYIMEHLSSFITELKTLKMLLNNYEKLKKYLIKVQNNKYFNK